MTPDQAKKTALLPANWPDNQRVFAVAACEGLGARLDDRLLLGIALPYYSGDSGEAIECFRAPSLGTPSFTVPVALVLAVP